MSKGNMFLGMARGKVGDIVFSRTNGQQVVRAHTAVIKNPQTESQMIQRIFLNTIAQAYSKMSAIVDHSFEGVQEGQKTMEFFMSRNLKALRTRVRTAINAGTMYNEIYEFSPISSNILAINTYEIAKGSLPAISVQTTGDDGTMGFALTENTYGGIISQYGLQRGDQLTFVALVESPSGERAFNFVRVILDPQDALEQDLPLDTHFIENGSVYHPNVRNEGSFVSLVYENGVVKFSLTSGYMLASAIIVSRKGTDGVWKRSNATLLANSDSAELTYDLQTCLDMLRQGDIAGLNARYLNNSGIGVLPNTAIDANYITALTFRGEAVERGAVLDLEEPSSETPTTAVFTCAGADGMSVGLVNSNGEFVSGCSGTVENGTCTITAPFGSWQVNGRMVAKQGSEIVDTYCTVSA